MKLDVDIVGAGLGGLAAAARLAHRGHRVQVFERRRVVGGKAAAVRARVDGASFTFDGGPSVLTMPELVDALYQDCGERRADHLRFTRVQPGHRYLWSDGSVLDEDAALWQRPEVAAYLEQASRIHALAMRTFLHQPIGRWWRSRSWDTLRRLGGFPWWALSETLAEHNARAFSDPRLRQVFDRFATYNGSSPLQAPALFAVMAHVQQRGGCWYPAGGFGLLAQELAALARRQGARVVLGQAVDHMAQRAGRLWVCNADVRVASDRLLAGDRRLLPLARQPLSLSGVALWLGVTGSFPQLAHHNVLFADDPTREFHQIFDEGRLPDEPTIYLGIPSRSGEQDAPPGAEAWYLQVHAPARPELTLDGYDDVVLRRLRRFGIELSPRDIVLRRRCGPLQYARRDQAWRGAFYGAASHGFASAFLRPPLQHPTRRDVFFVGGTVHPGGGIPPVLQGARMVAQLVDEQALAEGLSPDRARSR